ncbi:FAD/NAD(P)-binding oxidoreductase family protein [Euphorbia peplus]|nr:FAD/NAD(P)-binding oxidoreductase family protein [Euphorbia peplus]
MAILQFKQLTLSRPYLNPTLPSPFSQPLHILSASKRTGKQRYPSEKKKLKLKHKKALSPVEDKFQGIWRLSKLAVSVQNDPGKDFLGVSDGLLQEIAKAIEFPVASMLPPQAFTIVRKSFDARKMLKEPRFVYTVDLDPSKLVSLEPRTREFISDLEPKVGAVEYKAQEDVSGDLLDLIHDSQKVEEQIPAGGHGDNTSSGSVDTYKYSTIKKPKVAVVGSGPSGLFASLVLAELGADVTLIERGQPVEQRGRDIGALVVRRILESESNFCFGEGGAGTWSDGKLVTRIGRNSNSVLSVMKTLVHFGAPKSILIDGKPHLGTDKLIPLLRNFRQHLQRIGVSIMFGTRVDDLMIQNGHVVGVTVSNSKDQVQLDGRKLEYDAVLLAVGHSARDIYEMLLSHNIDLVPKDFAVGLRVEHPQELIDSIQYSALASEVCKGRGKVPVADYKIASSIGGEDYASSNSTPESRNCYSFCMCPGGQVVLTGTNPSEICINGMSFSRRASKWANSALVVTVSTPDFEALNLKGPLAGVEFQREFEQRAAVMGGGNFVVPAQTVTDFLENKFSVTSLPPSSYRLGVTAANLHDLFPAHITSALQQSILTFEKELPGFISEKALLHGVETRTSSPVQIPRNSETFESLSLRGLYPIGEGAGYAGGIVSAAVDGMQAGFAVAKKFNLLLKDIEFLSGKSQGVGVVKY